MVTFNTANWQNNKLSAQLTRGTALKPDKTSLVKSAWCRISAQLGVADQVIE